MRSFATLLVVLSLCAFGSAACASEEAAPEAEAPAAGENGGARISEPAPAVAPEAEGNRSVAERLEDAATAARIKKALVAEPALRPFDFDPEVTGERAVLFGDVQTLDERARAAAVAQKVEGVRVVENRLTVAGEPFAPEAEAVSAPAAPAVEGTAGAVYHTVRSGESLWIIARRNDTTVDRLKQLNSLRSNKVKPGERLRVR